VIEAGAGTHFDPQCVGAFLSVSERWEQQYAAAHVPYAEPRSL
jgi:HD-GYP domain-containing protein (c-di-GMP phosphodiesterase class II)